MNRKVKHSKVKNTGLLFEFLIRQLTADILENSSNNISLDIIKKRFNDNTELGKELQLYQALIKEKFKSDKKADYFISEVLNRRQKINNSQLRREKYNLVKEIKDSYDTNKFFSSKVLNYKVHAAIYKLFEYSNKISPEEKTESYFNILEHVTTNKAGIKLTESLTGQILPKNKDLRILTYRTLLEKFNSKYSSLDNNQRTLLRAYINNVSGTNSLKEYIEDKIPYMKTELNIYSKNVKDKVTKIKLAEAINSIDKFCKVKKGINVKDSTVIQVMRYYELLKELKNGSK